MRYKLSSLNNKFTLDKSKVVVSEQEIFKILTQSLGLSVSDARLAIKNAKQEGEVDIAESIQKVANTGVVVDLYEVDYPDPPDPMKHTQELAKHLDEDRDFVTQYLFPNSTTEDIQVDLQQNIVNKKKLLKSRGGKSWQDVTDWRRIL